MIELLAENPILLLFVVAAIGYPLGRLKVGGFGLGVAAVLFAGIGLGAVDPRLTLPDVVYQFGLVLFVYTIGLSSGPGFFRSFDQNGLRANGLVITMLLLAAFLTILAHRLLSIPSTIAVGMFAGSLTNTPALASVIEVLRDVTPPALHEQILAEPVVGYSIAYPIGVVGVMLAIYLTQRWWEIDYRADARTISDAAAADEPLLSRTVRVTNPVAIGVPLDTLTHRENWEVVFGRLKRAGHLSLATADTVFQQDDLVTIIAPQSQLEAITLAIGEYGQEELNLDRHEYDFRRMFVSNPRLAGRPLSTLDLPRQYGAIVTRVRRGDVDLLPHGSTILELGDRVRVLAPRERMSAVTKFFGDSYRALSEIDIATFSVGLALGLLLGVLPIPLPGGTIFRLGLAGGPLLVALVLGKLGRTGPLVWSLPYSANLTLRQLGLILFLAGVGTRSGYAFVSTLVQGGGAMIFLAGALITCVTALSTLWIGYHILKIPMGKLIGMLAGLQTQPAVLAFALEQSDNDLPNVGYATVYPIATIAKILAAQLLIGFLA